MARVAAVVLNSVSHDGRVLKEADSLAAAGHEVAIFGIQDNRDDTPEIIRDSGVRIVRIDWKADGYRLAADLTRGLSLGGAVALAGTSAGATRPAARVIRSLTLEHMIGGGLLGSSAVLAWKGRQQARKFGAASVRLRGQQAPQARSRTVVSKLGDLPTISRRAIIRRAGVQMMRDNLVDAILDFHPDVVHCHDLLTVPIGRRVKRQIGAKLVYDSHEIFEEVSQLPEWRRTRYRLLQQHISGDVDAFITVNERIAAFLAERYPKLPPAVVVKNAVKPQAGTPIDDGRLRRAAGVGEDSKILLYQGGFARFRGLDMLVRAAALLPPDWTLVMMGWGSYEKYLLRIADEVDPQRHKVRFIPGAPQAELREWTVGADLGVIPYENVCLNHWYCSPNKLWEYPAAGVPILASPFPILRETIERADIGLLLDEDQSPEHLATLLADLDDARLAQMAKNCKAYIDEDNWSTYEQRLVDAYGTLVT